MNDEQRSQAGCIGVLKCEVMLSRALRPMFIRNGLSRPGVVLALGLFWACSSGPEDESASLTRPNILMIVADDLGYGDIGAFGGEIDTPNLDALANSGVRFTRFYTQVTCSLTRSLLMTGVDNHLNGLGTMAEDRLPHHDGVPGYEGYLSDEVVTIASLLKDAGYHTYTTGKWHLGSTLENYPFHRGFERTYSLLAAGSNHFTGEGWKAPSGPSLYTENGKPTQRPEGPYSSDLFTDKLIDAIESDHGDGRPFFALLSFAAPHFPLQAPAALIDKYADRYAVGWDRTRQRRFERMKEMGLAPREMTLPPRIEEVPDWNELTNEERQIESRKMAIFAAMVDNLDGNVGRVLSVLEELGESDNTLVVFLSDNGNDPYERNQRPLFTSLRTDFGYDNSLANMGAANSFIFGGLGWAQVGSVHHRHYKFLPSEGGMHAPMIARYPGVLTPGDDRDAFASALDIAPTFLDIAGVEPPGTKYKGRTIHPMQGRSLLPYIKDSRHVPYGEEEAVAFEMFGHGVVYMGPWKAVRLRPPWEENVWRLYNLTADPGEEHDLSQEQPERLARLVEAYDDFAEGNGVIDEPAGVTSYPYKPGHLGDLIPED